MRRTLCANGMKLCLSLCGVASRLSAVPVQELLPCRACKPRSSQRHNGVLHWAVAWSSSLLQHIQLPQQCLPLGPHSSPLHSRVNCPFLIGSNLRSSTLGASATHRNAHCFSVKHVQSRLKNALNHTFFINSWGQNLGENQSSFFLFSYTLCSGRSWNLLCVQ